MFLRLTRRFKMPVLTSWSRLPTCLQPSPPTPLPGEGSMAGRRVSGLLHYYWISEDADAFDLGLDGIAGSEKDGRFAGGADAGGGAGRDDVAWFQSRERGQDRHQSRHRKDH